nr:MAG TPA: hypothetical protein [Caudoviricetes sp.]
MPLLLLTSIYQEEVSTSLRYPAQSSECLLLLFYPTYFPVFMRQEQKNFLSLYL